MANLKLSCLAAAVAISTMIVGGANEKAQAQAALSASAFKQKATQYIQSWNDRINKELKTYYDTKGDLLVQWSSLSDAQRQTLKAKIATAREAVHTATTALSLQLVGMTAGVFPDEGSALASFVSDQIKTREGAIYGHDVTVSAKYKWNIKSLKLGSLEGNATVHFQPPPDPKLPGL